MGNGVTAMIHRIRLWTDVHFRLFVALLFAFCFLVTLFVGIISSALACDGDACHDEVGLLAWMRSDLVGSGGGAVASCSSPECASTCLMAATEGFEGGSNACGTGDSLCINTWSGTGSPTLTNSPGTASEGTNCTTSIRFNANHADSYALWNYGSNAGTSTTDIIAYIYIADTISFNAWSSRNILSWQSHATTFPSGYNVDVNLYNAGGTYQIYCNGGTESTKTDLQTNTWIKITSHLDGTTAADSYCKIEDGTTTTCDTNGECTFTRGTAEVQYLFLGAATIDADDVIDIYFAYVSISQP